VKPEVRVPMSEADQLGSKVHNHPQKCV
jgi:hypothetical protein